MRGVLSQTEEKLRQETQLAQRKVSMLEKERDDTKAALAEVCCCSPHPICSLLFSHPQQQHPQASEEYRARFAELESQVRQLQDEKARLEMNIQGLQEINANQHDVLERTHQSHSEELAQVRALAERRLRSAQNEAEQVSEQLQQVTMQLTNAHTTIANLSTQNERIQSEADQRLSALEDAVHALKNERNELVLQYEEAIGRLREFAHEFKTFRETVELDEANTSRDLQQYQMALERMQAEREVIAEERDAARRNYTELREECEDLRSNRVVLEQTNASLGVELRALKERMRTMETELNEERELQAQAVANHQRAAREEIESLTLYLEEARNQHDTIKQQRTQLMEENAKLGEQLENMRQEANKRSREHNQQVQTLNDEIRQWRSKYTGKRSAMSLFLFLLTCFSRFLFVQ